MVREGLKSDWPFVIDLGRRTANDSASPLRNASADAVQASYDRLLTFVFRQSHVLLIAEDQGRPAGFLIMMDSLPDEVTMTPQAFIAYMAVEPPARNRGVGRALLAAAEAEARERKLPILSLMVTDANRAALALYESSGFGVERRLMCKIL